MANARTIALIADMHHGIDSGTTLGSVALALMQPFVDWVDAMRPDLVVARGDRLYATCALPQLAVPRMLRPHVVSRSGSAGLTERVRCSRAQEALGETSDGKTQQEGGGRWVCTKGTSHGSSHCSSAKDGSRIGCSTKNLA